MDTACRLGIHARIKKSFESRPVFRIQLGELDAISSVMKARYNDARGTQFPIVEPDSDIQLRSYLQREHHLCKASAESEIRGLGAERPWISFHMQLCFDAYFLARVFSALLSAWRGGSVGRDHITLFGAPQPNPCVSTWCTSILD